MNQLHLFSCFCAASWAVKDEQVCIGFSAINPFDYDTLWYLSQPLNVLVPYIKVKSKESFLSDSLNPKVIRENYCITF